MGPAVQSAPTLEFSAPQNSPREWPFFERIVFRFACSYMVLYNLPMMGHISLLDAIPGMPWLAGKYIALWHTLVPWVAMHVFKLSGPVTVYPAVNGSGDTTLDYIENLCVLVTAFAATLVWSVSDRRRD